MDNALADDLAQECFVKAWGRLHSYRGTGTLSSWLLQIAYREFLQSRRKHHRYGEVLEEFGHAARLTGGATIRAGAPEDLDRLLEILSDDERAAMILNYSYGMSHREIGETTGMPVGTIKSHIHRAKQRIRDAFSLAEADRA